MTVADERSLLDRAIEASDPFGAPPSTRDERRAPEMVVRPWNWKRDARSRFARAMLRAVILILSVTLVVVVAIVRLAHAETVARPPQTGVARPQTEARPIQTVPVRQLWVIDGDTLDVLEPTKDRIRLEGIDAPESYRPHCDAEKLKGLEAKREAIRLVRTGREATVVRHGHDRYGRTLGTVSIDGKDLGETLMSQGLALPYRPGSDAKAERIAHWCGPGEW